jgi:hypothetical protein
MVLSVWIVIMTYLTIQKDLNPVVNVIFPKKVRKPLKEQWLFTNSA